MSTCRIPNTVALRLKVLQVQQTPDVLVRLAAFCAQSMSPSPMAPWQFEKAVVQIPADADPARVERQLMSWAMQKESPLEWLHVPVTVQEPEPDPETHDCVKWRDEQLQIARKLNAKDPVSIALLEGDTGIGKTRAVCKWILELLGRDQGPVLLAVPTVNLAKQWARELAEVDARMPLSAVLGRSHYKAAEDQAHAISVAMDAQLVVCTHHMLSRLASMRRWCLVVDEAHVLVHAIAATAGTFVPAAALGDWFDRFLCKRLALPEGQPAEILLSGKLRQLALLRSKNQRLQGAGQVSVLVQSDGTKGLLVQAPGALEAALKDLWAGCSQALLLSATLGTQTSAGVRSVGMLVRRLAIPPSRSEDLGRVRAPWRDQGVVVRVPQSARAADKSLWLTPHARRKEQWYGEVAQVISMWSQARVKTLVLATSFEDVEGIWKALKSLGVRGVIASHKDEHTGTMQDHLKVIETNAAWCWIATGAAWTGMDLSVPLQRLAVSKLPLLNPRVEDGLWSQDVVFDCVSRFRQGKGRLVRGPNPDGIPKELVLLDGRVNESAPWWRAVVSPYVQVLAEDYEDHRVLEAPQAEGACGVQGH